MSTGPDSHHTLRRDDTLDGGHMLPDFSLKIADLFANIDLS